MIIQNGEPWWVAADVCDILGLSNSRETIKRLDEDEKGVSSIDTLGGKQEVAIVNEFGLYNLILGSRKPEAKEFKRWVTHEVLPQIRTTGQYIAKNTKTQPFRLSEPAHQSYGTERTALDLLGSPIDGVKYISGRDMVEFFRNYTKTASLADSPGYANRLIRKRAEWLAKAGKDVSLYYCKGEIMGENNRTFTIYYATKQGCEYIYMLMRTKYREEFKNFYEEWFEKPCIPTFEGLPENFPRGTFWAFTRRKSCDKM
ncbi:MAG: hypothetical protein LIO40_02915 [Ruminococcus sp.]|nr:hypothetical protein [Ruminococcus sp.]